MSLRARVLAFVALLAVCALGAVGAVLAAKPDAPERAAGAPGLARAGASEARDLIRGPSMVFRSNEPGDAYGRVAIAPLARPGAQPKVTDLRCDRVAVAGGRGICLQSDRGVVTTYKAVLFDAASFRPLHELELAGTPSRARMSPDGRYAAYTVFVSGHSYSQGGYSTRTAILDVEKGKEIAELETFEVLRDGRRIDAADFNFWGVTFGRDPNRFYATLGTGGKTFLLEGDVARRELKILRDGVECPSLSPDGKRIAFKQRAGGGLGPVRWRVAVLELSDATVRTLSETRNVDDQVMWLDDATVLYGLPRKASGSATTDVWAVRADGGGAPRRYLKGAWSPAPVMPSEAAASSAS